MGLRFRIGVSLALALALALAALAGCRSAAGQDGGAPGSEGPFVIGSMIPVSLLPETAAELKAIELALAEVQSTVGNRAVLLEQRDVKSEDVIATAESLLDEKGVRLLLTSSDAMAIPAIVAAAARKVPLVEIASQSPDFDAVPDADFAFRMFWASDAEGWGLARYAATQSLSPVALLFDDTEFGRPIRIRFEAAAKEAGLTLRLAEPLPDPLSAQVAGDKVRLAETSGAKAVVLVSLLDRALTVLDAAAAQGRTVPWASSSGVMGEGFEAKLKAQVRGRLTVVAPMGLGGAEYDAFEKVWKEKTGSPPEGLSYLAYDAAALAILALAEAGTDPSGPRLRDALRAVSVPPGIAVGATALAQGLAELSKGRDVDYQGASGPADFEATGNVKAKFYTWVIGADGVLAPKEPIE